MHENVWAECDTGEQQRYPKCRVRTERIIVLSSYREKTRRGRRGEGEGCKR